MRDDNKRQHPCLVEFSKLPETEKNYNLQMSTETLKWVLNWIWIEQWVDDLMPYN